MRLERKYYINITILFEGIKLLFNLLFTALIKLSIFMEHNQLVFLTNI